MIDARRTAHVRRTRAPPSLTLTPLIHTSLRPTPRIHRLSHDMGAGAARRRGALSLEGERPGCFSPFPVRLVGLPWSSTLSPPPSPSLFLLQIGVPFPKNFLSVVKTILKRLFRVYAHMYHSHFNRVVDLGEEPHLNTSFKHFIYFVQVCPAWACARAAPDRPVDPLLILPPPPNRNSTSLMSASWCPCRSSLSGSWKRTSEKMPRRHRPQAKSNADEVKLRTTPRCSVCLALHVVCSPSHFFLRKRSSLCTSFLHQRLSFRMGKPINHFETRRRWAVRQ